MRSSARLAKEGAPQSSPKTPAQNRAQSHDSEQGESDEGSPKLSYRDAVAGELWTQNAQGSMDSHYREASMERGMALHHVLMEEDHAQIQQIGK